MSIHLRYFDPDSDLTVCGLAPPAVEAEWRAGKLDLGTGIDWLLDVDQQHEMCRPCCKDKGPRGERWEIRDELDFRTPDEKAAPRGQAAKLTPEVD